MAQFLADPASKYPYQWNYLQDEKDFLFTFGICLIIDVIFSAVGCERFTSVSASTGGTV